jgi:hypothetical protein
MMSSGFDDWVYCHFFEIRTNYNSSDIELLLKDVCLTNLYEESLTNIYPQVTQLIALCYSVCCHCNVC